MTQAQDYQRHVLLTISQQNSTKLKTGKATNTARKYVGTVSALSCRL